VSSGQLHLNRKGNKSIAASNFFAIVPQGAESFQEIGVSPDFEIFSTGSFVIEFPYESTEVFNILPFVDRLPRQETFKHVSNTEIKDVLDSTSTRINFDNGYPGVDFKSKSCGYDYQNSRGIDSVSYGGLLK
jgi:hypothetical protein